MKKNILNLIVFCALFIAVSAQAALDGKVGIAAVVNDDIITFTDLQNRINLYLVGAPSAPPPNIRLQIQKKALNKLIDEKLQLQEAQSAGISINAEQLSKGLEQIARQNNMDVTAFKTRLENSGVELSTLQHQIRAEVAWAQVVSRKLRPQINVSENEIDSAMESVSRSSGAARYHIAEIFLSVPSPALESDVRTKAQQLAEDIKRGAPFSKVAVAHSQAPGAANGGDLGWMLLDDMPDALAAAAQKLSPGQLSPPVRSDKGYHILFLRNVQEPRGGVVPSSASTASATSDKTDKSAIVHLKQIVIPVLDNDPQNIVSAKIARAERLKSEIGSCTDMARISPDFPSPATGDAGEVAVSSLPLPFQNIVTGLDVGELSAPIRTDVGIAVVIVCSRKTPNTQETPAAVSQTTVPAQGEQARENIANKIGMQRLDQMQERYLRDLRATAFVDKRI